MAAEIPPRALIALGDAALQRRVLAAAGRAGIECTATSERAQALSA